MQHDRFLIQAHGGVLRIILLPRLGPARLPWRRRTRLPRWAGTSVHAARVSIHFFEQVVDGVGGNLLDKTQFHREVFE